MQATSVNSLRKVGWTAETLAVGDVVRVWGDLGHGDSRKLFMRGAEKDGVTYLPTGPVRCAESPASHTRPWPKRSTSRRSNRASTDQ